MYHKNNDYGPWMYYHPSASPPFSQACRDRMTLAREFKSRDGLHISQMRGSPPKVVMPIMHPCYDGRNNAKASSLTSRQSALCWILSNARNSAMTNTSLQRRTMKKKQRATTQHTTAHVLTSVPSAGQASQRAWQTGETDACLQSLTGTPNARYW